MNSGSGVLVIMWLALGLLWLLVPFSIFAIKRLLKEILAEQRRTNELLSGRPGTVAGQQAPVIPEFKPRNGFLG
jgi:hypothetical protein